MNSYSKNYYYKKKNGLNNKEGVDYTPSLTKEQLIEMGITYNPVTQGFDRDGKPMKELLQQINQCVYSNNKKMYAYYNPSIKGKQKSLLKHRLLYVWFVGDIPKGYVVDHINNNPLDNRIENLQLLTRSENTKKNSVGRNQLYYLLGEEEYLKHQQDRKDLKEAVELKKKEALLKKAEQLKKRINLQVEVGNRWVEEYNKRLAHIHKTEQLRLKIIEKGELINKLKAEYEAILIRAGVKDEQNNEEIK